MFVRYYEKKGFKERLVNGINIFLKNRKTKIVNMLVNGEEIFLLKTKANSKNSISYNILF